MSDMWSHSHDWDLGYATGHKDGYQQGRTDALSECLNIVRANGYQVSLIMIKGLLEQLNENKNDKN